MHYHHNQIASTGETPYSGERWETSASVVASSIGGPFFSVLG
jgi:hypothetical protein